MERNQELLILIEAQKSAIKNLTGNYDFYGSPAHDNKQLIRLEKQVGDLRSLVDEYNNTK